MLSMEQTQPQRIAYFDVLRILATLPSSCCICPRSTGPTRTFTQEHGKPLTFTTVLCAGLFRFS